MNIDYSSYTNSGGRPINEDSLFCRSDCFLVADGLGGHENGEVASAQAVRYISESFTGDIGDENVSRLLSGADEAVRSGGKGGKSTLAALFFSSNTAKFANVGDSRVYFFRSGQIIHRTKDHSVCQASVDMGDLKPDDVRGSDDRSGLFKVLGAAQPLKVPKPYRSVDIRDGDAFLLCSDGFWEYVYEMEMEADLLKSESAAEWLRHMVKRLLLRSGNSGDNYTAICGIIHAPEAARPGKRRLCSPVLIAGLAVSLAALGAVIAVKLLNTGSPEPTAASQPFPVTAEAASSAEQTQESAEASATAEQTATAGQTALDEPPVTTEQTATAGQTAPDEPPVTTEQTGTAGQTAPDEPPVTTEQTAPDEAPVTGEQTATAEQTAPVEPPVTGEQTATAEQTAPVEPPVTTEQTATAEQTAPDEAELQPTTDNEVNTNDRI